MGGLTLLSKIPYIYICTDGGRFMAGPMEAKILLGVITDRPNVDWVLVEIAPFFIL